jgi:hypothetical protein
LCLWNTENVENNPEQSINQPLPTEQAEIPKKNYSFKKTFWIFFIVSILIAVIIAGGYILATKQNAPLSQNQQKTIISPTPLLTGTSAKADDRIVNWKTYKSGEDYKYEIKYPNDWEVNVQGVFIESTFFHKEINDVTCFFGVEDEPYFENIISYHIKDWVTNGYRKNDVQLAGFQTAKLSDEKLSTGSYYLNLKMGDMSFMKLSYSALQHKKGKIFSKECEDIFGRMVSSFRVLGKGSRTSQAAGNPWVWQEYESGKTISGLSISYPKDWTVKYYKEFRVSSNYDYPYYRIHFDFAPSGWNNQYAGGYMGWGSMMFDVYDPQGSMDQYIENIYPEYKTNLKTLGEEDIGGKPTFRLESRDGSMWAPSSVILGTDYSYDLGYSQNGTSDFVGILKKEIFPTIHIN